MWFLVRPDATNVWKNQEVRQRYARYRAILDKEKFARYLITKKIAAGIDLDNSLEELWQAHEKAAQEFQKQIIKIDQGELSLEELPSPKVSFLDLKEQIAQKILESCHFCERRCEVNRATDQLGYCRVGKDSLLSSAFLHSGEESILVPSGTIFFTGCTFRCVFCQNQDISQEWFDKTSRKNIDGVKITPRKLALTANQLWKKGAKNINLVGGDPTPNVHTIISALKEFKANSTILWNSNMYQSLEVTKLLLELIDFWLPDFKFWENDFAKRMCDAENYQEIITRNIKLAYEKGSGEILIRHLIMPGRVEQDTYPILEWCAKEIPKSMVNLMDQYHPDHLVLREPGEYRDINRRISSKEWQKATTKADELGIFWRPVS